MNETAAISTLKYQNSDKANYFIFKYLWLFIIVPKTLQLVLLAGYFLSLFAKNNWQIKIPKCVRCFFGIAVVHFISIIINSFLDSYEFSRILAAFNTDFICFIALGIFSLIYNSTEKFEAVKIGKYCLINQFILLAVYITSLIFNLELINFGFETRMIWGIDYLNGEQTVRFVGLFEYPVLEGLFILFSLPFLSLYLIKTNKKLLFFISLAVSLWLIKECGSRSALILGIAEICVCLWYFLKTRKIKNQTKILIITLAVTATVCFALFNHAFLENKITDLILSRSGSNSTRFNIYEISISTAWEQSPLIGLGIKKMLGNYPLGSHSTYIGVFYKTGIIGVILLIFGLIGLLSAHIRKIKSGDKKDLFIFLYILLFALALIFEDLDGADWLIVLFFTMEGVCLKPLSNRGNMI